MTADATVDLELDRSWTYGADLQHGGHLLERVTGAALGRVDHPHPLAVSAHYLKAPRLGPVSIETDVLRVGRSVSTVHARLVQDGRTCLDATVTAGELPAPGPPVYAAGGPPVLPPVEDCLRNARQQGEPRNGITEQLDLRLDPTAAGWLTTPSGVAEVRGWVRYALPEDASAECRPARREPDPLALVCLADALPPVTFALGLTGWVPTVELTVHVRALPAPGWLRLVQRAQVIADGWLDETCEIWDSTDRLVAQAVQLAAYRPA